MTTAPTVEELVQALQGASRPLDAAGQRLAVALYRTLAEGEPVAAAELASRTGRSVQEVTAGLDGWPSVFYDEHQWTLSLSVLSLPRGVRRCGAALRRRQRVAEQPGLACAVAGSRLV